MSWSHKIDDSVRVGVGVVHFFAKLYIFSTLRDTKLSDKGIANLTPILA